MKISGIYKIINKVNGKYYVGSSKQILEHNGRFYEHKRLLRQNKHINPHLQNAWNRYGEDNFNFVLVENVNELNLLIVEQKYLDIAKLEKHKCYNISFIAGKVEMTDKPVLCKFIFPMTCNNNSHIIAKNL
jgi:group I intron endonuclease